MELPEHWLTHPLLDAEYKRYELLAFLQHVERRYAQKKLFPYKQQVQRHNDTLSNFSAALNELEASFPKKLKGLDHKAMRLHFEAMFQNGNEMGEIERIVEHALPLLRSNLAHAEELLDELKTHIEAFTVGVLPLNVQFGYLLLKEPRSTRVYEYRLNKVADSTASLDLRTRYINSWPHGLASNFEQIKLELITSTDAVANPATFGFVSSVGLPPIETYLPLAKQLTLQLIKENSAQNTLSDGEK